MHIENIIKIIKAEYHISEIPKKDNAYCLTVNREISILLEESHDHTYFYIYIPVAKLPSKNIEKICYRLLCTNLFLQNTNGGVFAIDERSNSVILFQRLDSYHLNYHTFIENLENLLSVYHEWKQKVIYPESIGVAKLTDEVPQQNHLGRIRA